MTTDQLFLLLLRLGAVLLLYVFIWRIAVVIRRDLREQPAAFTAPSDPARLVVLQSQLQHLPVGLVIAVEGSCTLGRANDNQLTLNEPFISGHHAQIFWEDGAWHVRDLGSTNGTWINERKIDRISVLRSGDTLQLGQWQARFEA